MTTSTNLWLQSSEYADLAMVLLFDGYNLGFTSHNDVAGIAAAWSSATSGKWSNIKGGLKLGGVVKRSIHFFEAEIQPSSMTFSVLDVDDVLLPLLFGDARSSVKRTRLKASMDSDDTTLSVNDTSLIPSQPNLFVGLEQMDPTAEDGTADTWTVTRGVNALHKTESGGDFAWPHEIDPGGGASPEVTDGPTKWLNRGVCLLICHRDPTGAWSAGMPGQAANDAELYWAGRIKHYAEDGQGWISLSCVEITELIRTSVGTRLYQGELAQGTTFQADEVEIRTDVQNHQAGGNVAYSRAVTSMSALVGAPVTHLSVAAAINAELIARFIGSPGTYGPTGATMGLYLAPNANGDMRYQFVWSNPGAAAGDRFGVYVELGLEMCWLLGWDVQSSSVSGYGSATGTNSTLFLIMLGLSADNKSGTAIAPLAPNRWQQIGSGAAFTVGNVVSGTEFVPQTRLPADAPEGTQGFLLVNKQYIFAVTQTGTSPFDTFDVVMNDRYKEGNAPFLDAGDISHYENFNVREGGSGPETMEVSQIWIEPGIIGEQILRLLVSTGTTGFNSATWDDLPLGLGCGIPFSLVDADSILSLGSQPYLLFFHKATAAIALIDGACNLTGRHLVWRNGKIGVISPLEGAEGDTDIVALTENNRATQIQDGAAMKAFVDRTTSERNPESIVNRMTLRYNLDLAGKWQRTLDVFGVQSQSDYGEVRSVIVDGYGIYDNLSGTTEPLAGGADYWVRTVTASALTYFGQPLGVFERSFDLSLAGLLFPGSKLSVTDSGLVDPNVGTRGCTNLRAWAQEVEFDWMTGVGRVTGAFSPGQATSSTGTKGVPWAPSARVDETYSPALAADASTAAMYKFNELSVPGTGYATAVDAAAYGGTARDLSSSGEVLGLTSQLMHIINGPIPTLYARWFPGGLGPVHLSRAGDATGIATFLGSYTIEAWVRFDSLDSAGAGAPGDAPQLIFSYVGDASNNEAENHLIRFSLITTGWFEAFWEHDAGIDTIVRQTSGTALTAGGWHHVAMTCDNSGASSVVRFYMDGAKVFTSGTFTKATGGTNALWRLGGDDIPGVQFHGAIKDCRISNVKRSDADIAADAALTTYQHAIDGNTVAMWRLNEAPDAFEESAYGYHLRKVTGTIDIVDPLAPDDGKARDMGATTYYIGHWGYETLRAALAGDWTFETWTDLASGWDS